MDNIPLVQRGQALLMASGKNSLLVGLYHFALLIWKGFLQRKRHYIVTILELFIPILISGIPVIIYAEIVKYGYMSENSGVIDEHLNSRFHNATYYEPFDPRNKDTFSILKTVYVIFTPNNTLSKQLTDDAMKLWKDKASVEIENSTGVSTEADLENEVLRIQINKGYNQFVIIGLVYSNFPGDDGAVPGSLDYKIRYGNRDAYFNTESTYPPFRIGPPYKSSEYSRTFFLAVQASVDHAFVNMHNAKRGYCTRVGQLSNFCRGNI